ncbi:MAG: hypothetical protein MZU95_09505 [Desulfomicrobium escambiense]|nr:hypothetical protein [Desulfomicrobium escambiense]
MQQRLAALRKATRPPSTGPPPSPPSRAPGALRRPPNDQAHASPRGEGPGGSLPIRVEDEAALDLIMLFEGETSGRNLEEVLREFGRSRSTYYEKLRRFREQRDRGAAGPAAWASRRLAPSARGGPLHRHHPAPPPRQGGRRDRPGAGAAGPPGERPEHRAHPHPVRPDAEHQAPRPGPAGRGRRHQPGAGDHVSRRLAAALALALASSAGAQTAAGPAPSAFPARSGETGLLDVPTAERRRAAAAASSAPSSAPTSSTGGRRPTVPCRSTR